MAKAIITIDDANDELDVQVTYDPPLDVKETHEKTNDDVSLGTILVKGKPTLSVQLADFIMKILVMYFNNDNEQTAGSN